MRRHSDESGTRGERPAALLAVLTLCALLAGCGEEPRVASTEDLSEDLPDQELFNTTIYDTEGGERRWILRSDRLARYRDQDEAQLFGVHMDFYKADTLFSTLTSRRGRAHMKTNDLFAWGDVVVVTRDGRRLETEELDYDDARGRISNEVFNRFTRGDDVMTGIGMEATPDLDRFELKQAVEATVYDEEEPAPGFLDKPIVPILLALAMMLVVGYFFLGSARTGSLRIQTVPPGAEIYLNGDYQGKANPSLEMKDIPIGRQRLSIAKDGFRTHRTIVVIREGAVVATTIPLQPGR